MPIRHINIGTEGFVAFANALRNEQKREPEDFLAGIEGSGTVVLGEFDGHKLKAFSIFQPFQEPSLHLGGMFEPGYFKNLREIVAVVAVYNISLIHTVGGNKNLAASASKLIHRFEELLLEGNEEYCLLISLFKNANRKAFLLYRSLGFNKRGSESYLMDVDPVDILDKYGRAEKEGGTIFLKTFQEMDEEDLQSLSNCYSKVFTLGIDVEVEEHLLGIIKRPSFLPELSILVCDSSERAKVIGFYFIEKSTDMSIYISAAGLQKNFRGRRITGRSFSWVMENCLNHGYRKALLITASPRLKTAFSRMICARHRDTLMWFIKCGIRDD